MVLCYSRTPTEMVTWSVAWTRTHRSPACRSQCWGPRPGVCSRMGLKAHWVVTATRQHVQSLIRKHVSDLTRRVSCTPSPLPPLRSPTGCCLHLAIGSCSVPLCPRPHPPPSVSTLLIPPHSAQLSSLGSLFVFSPKLTSLSPFLKIVPMRYPVSPNPGEGNMWGAGAAPELLSKRGTFLDKGCLERSQPTMLR